MSETDILKEKMKLAVDELNLGYNFFFILFLLFFGFPLFIFTEIKKFIKNIRN